MTEALPASNLIKLPENGEPYLEGYKCSNCGEVYVSGRQHCANCAGTDCIEPHRLGNTGKLYVFSIVNRSFPGIKTPFVSAIVDLDGGGTLKGNLIGVEADASKIDFDMPVEVVFDDALGRKDKEGNSYISYFFKPANQE